MRVAGNVLIVGGGLGGLAAAIALRRIGCQVELVEQNPQWEALGAGLTFNGATARAFAQIGVLEQVVAQGCVHGTSSVRDANGLVLVESDEEEVYGPGIPVMGGILRPVLHQIMKDRARVAGVAPHLGVTVSSFEQDSARVLVSLSNGSTGSYDLVIAADGVTSRTRKMLFPTAPEPKFTGQGCWRAVVPRPADVATSEVYFGGRSKAGINPVSSREMYLFLLCSVPDNRWMPVQEWPQLLRTELAGFGGHIGYVRDRLSSDSRINYRPLETLVLPDPWYKGRILLIGDAAHATTPHVGYGAGLAIEDGVVLAELLEKSRSLEGALETFMKRRYSRCRAIVNGSVELGQMEINLAPVSQQRMLTQDLYALIRQPA